MNALVPMADAVSAVLFLAAAALVIMARPRKDAAIDRWFRMFFAAAMGLYVIVGVSNALEHLGISDAFDVYEDYIEILFVPLILYAAHQAYMRTGLNERLRSYWALSSQYDLTLHVIDTVPCGVVIVDDTGRVTFANARARDQLELSEDPVTGGFRPVDWIALGADGEPEPGVEPGRLSAFAGLTDAEVEQRVRWPDGRTVTLSVSSTSMASRSGGIGGSIVAFEVVAVGR